MKVAQRGGFAIGLVTGLLVGLALALGVALYITKVPVPFVDKVPHRSAEQDQAEAERNKRWDPNAPLAPAAPVVAPAPAPTTNAGPARATDAPATARDPAAILSGAPMQPPAQVPAPSPAEDPGVAPPVSTAGAGDPFTYLVQVGAFRRPEDAEAQRARLAMQGLTARISEREQAGRTVYRVRVGPFERRAEADAVQQRLKGDGVDGQLVRVQRP
jgi:cell division protein FtsN